MSKEVFIIYKNKKISLGYIKENKSGIYPYFQTQYTINNGDLSTVSNSIYLFGTHSPSGGAQTSSERIYEFKLWDNDVLVRDMVPVLNGSSVPGMYDKITGTFYQNLGTGDFTYNS